MEKIDTGIEGLVLLKPKLFGDDRGYFYESYNSDLFRSLTGFEGTFVQDNQSQSKKGVVRGLHFQRPPYAQDKLVRVLKGSVLDVAVDLRKGSATYGRSYSVVLSGENHLQLFVPAGFAHGFATLEDDTVFVYKCSNFYNRASEDNIIWNDETLQIDWMTTDAQVSEKDSAGKKFVNFESPF